jgi:hypothetical protein
MKRERSSIWFGVALALLAYAPLHAVDSDDSRLTNEGQQIDQDKTAATDDQKTDVLAKEFHVRESTILDLRKQGQGWGEITIELSLARELKTSDPKDYPTLKDALGKVETLRASGEGWGKIAQDLGFKLGPVIREAHHERHDLHEALHDRPEHHDEVHEQVEHPEHPDRDDHPSHPEHPDHPEMPDRPGH